jgi:hypothetical protein
MASVLIERSDSNTRLFGWLERSVTVELLERFERAAVFKSAKRLNVLNGLNRAQRLNE